jgi:nicotinate-nucleotide adenylyltransferase
MTPIGLLGGTFDPVHIGHLRTATEVLEHLRLDEIRFVPCRVPPHAKSPVASVDLRLRMLHAAVDRAPGCVVDERELGRAGPSYTVDTLESLRADLPDCSLALIVGVDAFADLTSWHRWEEIPELAHLVVVHRPGATMPADGPLGALLDDRYSDTPAVLRDAPAGRILVHTVTPLDVSSTEIRELVGRGQSPNYLVPEAVADIIAATGCYLGAERAVG